MTVSSSTNRVSYAGNGSTTVFPYTFKIFDEDDLTVILRSASGTETTKTITSDYTVSGVGSAGGGNVTMLVAPATGETLVILREQDLIQELDIVPNDPFPADSLEAALDKLTFMVQQHEETLGRTIKASRTNTITSSEFTVSAADRANKIFAFDSTGELAVTQELGTYRGNWAASTAYAQRDIVKDTTNNNIYICIVAHTSTGSLPISTNADVAKWALLVDAASATASQVAAAASAAAAAVSETNAGNSETAAAASEAAAAASETAAAASETAAAASAAAAAVSETNAAASEAAAAASAASIDPATLLTKAGNLSGIADAAVARSNIGAAGLSVAQTFGAGQRGNTQTASITGSTTLDFATYQNFVLTLTGNVTLANPTTEVVGQSGFIVFVQDGTGGRTVSLGTDYETAGGAGLTLSAAASTTDIVPYIVAASGRILLGAPQLAFS